MGWVGWVVLGAWIAAVLLAAVVLAFCAYELSWKSRRLRADLERLAGLSAQLRSVGAELEVARRRALGAAALTRSTAGR